MGILYLTSIKVVDSMTHINRISDNTIGKTNLFISILSLDKTLNARFKTELLIIMKIKENNSANIKYINNIIATSLSNIYIVLHIKK